MLGENSEKIELWDYLQILEEAGVDNTLEILAGRVPFVPLEHSFYSTDTPAVFWLRFKLENSSASLTEWLLEYNFSRSGIALEVYLPGNEGYQKKEDNPLIPFSRKDVAFRNPAFNLRLNPGEEKIYYIKMAVEKSAFLEFRLWNKEYFIAHIRKDQFFYEFFTGIVFIMIFYNLFLLFSFRDLSYLYYVLFIFAMLVIQLNNHGLLSEALPLVQAFDATLTDIAQICAFLLFVLFTRNYLSLRLQNKLLYTTLTVTVYCGIGFFIISLLFPPFFTAVRIAMIFGGVAAIASAVYLYIRKHYAHILLYLLAIFTLVISGILVSLPNDVAHLFFSDFSYTMDLSTLGLISIFAFGLAYRIRRIIKEKDRYQQQIIETLEQTDRLKDEFLANTSHELRTPLNHIIGFTASLISGDFGEIPPPGHPPAEVY